MKFPTKDYLNGKCAAFALAAHEASGWPIYVGKTVSKSGLDTHVFVYDKHSGEAYDARGFFKPEETNMVMFRPIDKNILKLINRLHLHIIKPKDIERARKHIEKDFE